MLSSLDILWPKRFGQYIFDDLAIPFLENTSMITVRYVYKLYSYAERTGTICTQMLSIRMQIVLVQIVRAYSAYK